MVKIYRFREAKLADIRELLSIEKKCWESHLAGDEKRIFRYLKNSREQFVVEFNREIVGVLFTQRISSVSQLVEGKFEIQQDLHDSKGSILQLCSIAVDGNASSGNIGAELRNFALQYAHSLCGEVKKVVAMTRCGGFDCLLSLSELSTKQRNDNYESYVMSARDPTIFFHVSGGAKIVQIVHDYRQEDYQNLGHGVLIAYDIFQVCQE